MKPEIILSPRFTGDRFQNHAIPLALLKNLDALQGIISEIVRAQFIEKHPGRKRLPRGFCDGLTLFLAGTGEGSFVANIALIVSTQLIGGAPELLASQAARDTFMEAVADPKSGAQKLPDAVWPCIERLGRGLRDDEAIVLGKIQGKPAELTNKSWRELLLSRPSVQTFSDELQTVVRLDGCQKQKNTLLLALDDDRILDVQVSDAMFGELKDVRFEECGSTWVQVTGSGSFDRSLQLQSIDEVLSIERLEPLDPRVQIQKLKRLRDGWLDGKGIAPDEQMLRRAGRCLDECLTENTELPRLYPTPEGGIEAEWLIGRRDLSIEFDPSTRTIEWHSMGLDTQEVEELSVSFDDTEGLRSVGEKTACLAGRQE